MGKVKNLLPDEPEEGGACPVSDCTGHLEIKPTDNCTCFSSPPCGACVTAPFICDTCKEEFDNG